MQLYDFMDYRQFLRKQFSPIGMGRGQRGILADYLNCQASFLTQVMTEKSHLSLEHAIRVCDFLKFDESESDYFMLLVQKSKAGSQKLESHFDKKLHLIKENRSQIKTRIGVQTELSVEDQMIYYSVWYYSAIHILTSIPIFNSAESIAKTLNLDLLTIKNALNFLLEKGFVEFHNEKYSIGSRRIHLSQSSPMLPRHHCNWRTQTMAAIDNPKKNDLHYTAVLSLSEKDVLVLREKMLKLLEDFESVIIESKEETIAILLFDLFKV